MFERSHTASTLYARAYSVGDSCYSFPCRFTRAHAKMSKDMIPTFFRAPILTPDWGIAGVNNNRSAKFTRLFPRTKKFQSF